MSYFEFILRIFETPNVYLVSLLLLVAYYLYLSHRRGKGTSSRRDDVWYLVVKLFVVLNGLSVLVTLAFFLPRALSTLQLQTTSSQNYAHVFQTVFPKAYWCSSTGNMSKDCSDHSIAHMIDTRPLGLATRPQFAFVRLAVDNRLEWLDPTNGEFRSREVDSTFTHNLRESLRSRNPIGFSSFSLADYLINPCGTELDYSYYCEDGFRHGVVFVRDGKGETLGAAVWFEGGGDNFGTLTSAPFILFIFLMAFPYVIYEMLFSPFTLFSMLREGGFSGIVFFFSMLVAWAFVILILCKIITMFLSRKKSAT